MNTPARAASSSLIHAGSGLDQARRRGAPKFAGDVRRFEQRRNSRNKSQAVDKEAANKN